MGFKWDYLGFNKINRKDIRIVLLLLLVSLPISFVASQVPEIKSFYMLYPLTVVGALSRLIGMTITEFVFRGVLMFGVFGKTGRKSILLQDIPYMVAHLGKPILEVPYSGIVGLLFGFIDYRSKSILPSLLLHSIGSEIFILIVHLL